MLFLLSCCIAVTLSVLVTTILASICILSEACLNNWISWFLSFNISYRDASIVLFIISSMRLLWQRMLTCSASWNLKWICENLRSWWYICTWMWYRSYFDRFSWLQMMSFGSKMWIFVFFIETISNRQFHLLIMNLMEQAVYAILVKQLIRQRNTIFCWFPFFNFYNWENWHTLFISPIIIFECKK